MKRKLTFKPTATRRDSRGMSVEETGLAGVGGRFLKGYTPEGTVVYVPVDNLEAMKTLVNMNLRHRRDSAFSKVPDFSSEQKELDRYLTKLEGLVEKLDHPLGYEDIHELGEWNETIDDNELIHRIKEQINAQRRKSRMSRAFLTGHSNIPRIERKTIVKTDGMVAEDMEVKAENGQRRKSKFSSTSKEHKSSFKESTTTPTNRIFPVNAETKTKNALRKSKQKKKIIPQQKKISTNESTTLPNRILPNDLQTKTENVVLKSNVTFKPIQNQPSVETNKTLQISPTTLIKYYRSLTTIPEDPTIKSRSNKPRYVKTENKGTERMNKIKPEIYPPSMGIGDIRSKFSTARFFIYGQFKNDQRPVFLVQPYSGNSLLGKKKLPLDSESSENDIDVFVSGQFYQRNILHVSKDMTRSIRIGNRKIIIDRRSVMFEEGVTDALSTNELFIVVGGHFIRQAPSPFITPSLFIGVERCVGADKNLSTQVSRKQFFLSDPRIPTFTTKMPEFQQTQEQNEKVREFKMTRDGEDYSRNNRVTSEGAFVFNPNIPIYTIETRGCKLNKILIEGRQAEETTGKGHMVKSKRLSKKDKCGGDGPGWCGREVTSQKVTCYANETGGFQKRSTQMEGEKLVKFCKETSNSEKPSKSFPMSYKHSFTPQRITSKSQEAGGFQLPPTKTEVKKENISRNTSDDEKRKTTPIHIIPSYAAETEEFQKPPVSMERKETGLEYFPKTFKNENYFKMNWLFRKGQSSPICTFETDTLPERQKNVYETSNRSQNDNMPSKTEKEKEGAPDDSTTPANITKNLNFKLLPTLSKWKSKVYFSKNTLNIKDSPKTKQEFRNEPSIARPPIPVQTIETRGFELIPTRTEGNETVYESSPCRKLENTVSDMLPELKEPSVYEIRPRKNAKARILLSPRPVSSRTTYGDGVEDVVVCEKEHVQSSGPAVYECGRTMRSKSDIALKLNAVQSRTEYGDLEVNRSKSTKHLTDESSVPRSKHRKPYFLRRLNEIIMSGEKRFNFPNRFRS